MKKWVNADLNLYKKHYGPFFSICNLPQQLTNAEGLAEAIDFLGILKIKYICKT